MSMNKKKLLYGRLLGGMDPTVAFPGMCMGAPEGTPMINPNMPWLAEKYAMGMVHVINCSGNEQPTGSHFDQREKLGDRGNNITGPTGKGWLDHMLGQSIPEAKIELISAIVGSNVLPRILQGGMSNAIGIDSKLRVMDTTFIDANIAKTAAMEDLSPEFRDFLINEYKLVKKILSTDIDFTSKASAAVEMFTKFEHMRAVLFEIPGFDTHSDNDRDQVACLRQLDGFLSELGPRIGWDSAGHPMGSGVQGSYIDEPNDSEDDLLIYITSEFSRGLERSPSDGTSHGRAPSAILIGRDIQGGFTNQIPTLKEGRELLIKASLRPQFIPWVTAGESIDLGVGRWMGLDTSHTFTKEYPVFWPFKSALPAAKGPEWIDPRDMPSGGEYAPPDFDALIEPEPDPTPDQPYNELAAIAGQLDQIATRLRELSQG